MIWWRLYVCLSCLTPCRRSVWAEVDRCPAAALAPAGTRRLIDNSAVTAKMLRMSGSIDRHVTQIQRVRRMPVLVGPVPYRTRIRHTGTGARHRRRSIVPTQAELCETFDEVVGQQRLAQQVLCGAAAVKAR